MGQEIVADVNIQETLKIYPGLKLPCIEIKPGSCLKTDYVRNLLHIIYFDHLTQWLANIILVWSQIPLLLSPSHLTLLFTAWWTINTTIRFPNYLCSAESLDVTHWSIFIPHQFSTLNYSNLVQFPKEILVWSFHSTSLSYVINICIPGTFLLFGRRFNSGTLYGEKRLEELDLGML